MKIKVFNFRLTMISLLMASLLAAFGCSSTQTTTSTTSTNQAQTKSA